MITSGGPAGWLRVDDFARWRDACDRLGTRPADVDRKRAVRHPVGVRARRPGPTGVWVSGGDEMTTPYDPTLKTLAELAPPTGCRWPGDDGGASPSRTAT